MVLSGSKCSFRGSMYKWLDAREDMQDSPALESMVEEKVNKSSMSSTL